MKTVFTNRGCVRAWLRQGQQHGRSGNGNLSFRGRILYSYSMPIAKIINLNLVLVTTEGYSVTTSKHKGYIWLNTFTRCDVPSLEPDHNINLNYFLSELKETVIRWSNANIRGLWALRLNHRYFKQLQEYCKLFNLEMPLTLGLYLDPNYKWIKDRIWKTSESREIIVPRWLAIKANSQTGLEPKDILKTRNAEVRREIVKRVGIERICFSLNAEIVDKQGNYELLLLDLQDGRKRPFLKMLNPSVPECWHIEGVHPACRTVQGALNYRRYGEEIITGGTWERTENGWGVS